MHGHEDYVEFMAVVAGSGRHILAGRDGATRIQPLRPGMMLFFRPQDEHALDGDARDRLQMLHAAFPLVAWRAFVELTGLGDAWTRAADPPTAEFDPADRRLHQAFDDAAEALIRRSTVYDGVRLLLEIAPRVVPSPEHPDRPGVPRWLSAAVAALSEADAVVGGIARLREVARVSPTHLSRTVRRYYGVTPSELVEQTRLARAAVLLDTGATVSDIAARCGYATPSYFATRFRQAYGVSPRDYRRDSARGTP
jgi:AraC-like DNA-binding protein